MCKSILWMMEDAWGAATVERGLSEVGEGACGSGLLTGRGIS